jgi:phosphatidylinositol alpha-mannosyltransferase
VRIALVSPYSWTYPGGVTRHIEALAGELRRAGHDVRVLAPFDPDDALTRRLHRGAAPQPRDPPEGFVSLGRTVGIPANGAISNLALGSRALTTLRAELRNGGYDVAHIHEPVAPLVGWDAMCCAEGVPLVGTFHSYSENALTNGVACLLGAARRMNRLRVRIAVSESAAWTARRFFGGRYRVVPNGVHLEHPLQAHAPVARPQPAPDGGMPGERTRPLRILFIGQAVGRKGLPVLLSAFEALREQVPATLTLVGAQPEEVAPLLLESSGVRALGRVGEREKLAELARADVLCAPSLRGESFGMVLTEAFAAGVPVVASNIAGYRDVVRDGREGILVAPGDAVALAHALRTILLDEGRRAEMAAAARERARRFGWPRVAADVVQCYEQAVAIGSAPTRRGRLAIRYGLASADLKPREPRVREPAPGQRGADGEPPVLGRPSPSGAPARRGRGPAPGMLRRVALGVSSLVVLGLGGAGLADVGVGSVVASLAASRPSLLMVGLGLMCVAMLARGLAWHAILQAAPTGRRARLADALQGTFIGVLMSATLPARLGEPSRALVVARRLGRARETLPIVLGTLASQMLLNLLAVITLGAVTLTSVKGLQGHDRPLVALAVMPVAALLALLLAPVIVPGARASRSLRLDNLWYEVHAAVGRIRHGLRVFCKPREACLAVLAQFAAWGLQLLACWFLLAALGLAGDVDLAGAAAILFAVNLTALLPVTPANVGVFQAAVVAVLVGAYDVSAAAALAYGILLQAVELATAFLMGTPALAREGLSWRELRVRTMHATPVKLDPLPERMDAEDGLGAASQALRA